MIYIVNKKIYSPCKSHIFSFENMENKSLVHVSLSSENKTTKLSIKLNNGSVLMSNLRIEKLREKKILPVNFMCHMICLLTLSGDEYIDDCHYFFFFLKYTYCTLETIFYYFIFFTF